VEGVTQRTEDHWAGRDGTTYQVEAGQVWAVGERHVFVCSDLMNSTLYDEQIAVGLTQPAIIYCDPPWGQGLVNQFRAKAGLPKANYRWEALYRRIADLGHARGLPVWLEGSVLESNDGKRIFGTMRPLEGQRNHYWQIEYGSHSPCGLYYSSTVPHPESLTPVLTGVHDQKTPGIVMAAYGSTGVVLEPCCGLGGTPVNAERAGWGSLCNEINPYRMSTAMSRVAQLSGSSPRLVRT